MKSIRKRLTYADVMSTIAVFLILGGATALAATKLGKNSVGTKQIKNNAVTTAKIKNGAVTGAKVKSGSLTGTQINASTLGTVPNATNATNATTAGAVAAGAVTPAGLASIPVARVSDNTEQVLPNETPVTLNFNTESFDIDNLHSTTTNSSRLTAPIAGIYRVSASVGFILSSSTTSVILELVKNGTVDLFDTQNPTEGNTTFSNATDLVKLNAGDFVQVVAEQKGATSGSSAFSCSPAESCPSFSMEWVAPS